MQNSTFNIEIYCTIVSVVKYRELFQVYNNNEYFIFVLNSKFEISKLRSKFCEDYHRELFRKGLVKRIISVRGVAF